MKSRRGFPAPAPARKPVGDRLKFARTILVPLLLSAALGACASTKAVSPETTGSIGTPITTADFEKAAAYWGDRYAENPKDRTVELNYASALRRLGRTDQAVAVLERAAIYHPEDRDVQAAYGKALADAGQLDRGLEILKRAERPDQPDWRLVSSEAAIMDQMGRHDEARGLYQQALQLAPNEPSVLSNLGMSYLIAGNLPEAERYLRLAVAQPNADSRVRQNLALAVGLSGRFAEAEKIASAELPPDEAAANVAYLKSMMKQQDAWRTLTSAAPAAETATN